jgi:hypothetical protein
MEEFHINIPSDIFSFVEFSMLATFLTFDYGMFICPKIVDSKVKNYVKKLKNGSFSLLC